MSGNQPGAAPTAPGDRPPILLFGATSMLGFNLVLHGGRRFVPIANRNNRIAADLGWERLDAADAGAVAALVSRYKPEIVLYCDAVCDVPKCEQDPSWARAINVSNFEILLSQLEPQTRLVYVSSDHVFGGDGTYNEGSPVSPISVYGETRVEAEALVAERQGALLIRVGLPVGRSLDGRSGHLDWLRYRHGKGLPITIIRDEQRSAVWADQLAKRVLELAESDVTGCRHVVATRPVMRPDLAAALMARMGLPPAFDIASRTQQPYPHLGQVELATVYDDPLAQPLDAVVSSSEADVETADR
ncbi:MAG: sugar nucleotide-binding protein [Myxococcota bacterium]